ncbi:MAG: hypothetical protein AB1767_08615 [Bacillota bacterium]
MPRLRAMSFQSFTVFYLCLAVLLPLLATGLFLAYILLSRYPGLLQVPVSPSALFLAYFYPALAVLILKVYRKPRCPVSAVTGAAGLVLFLPVDAAAAVDPCGGGAGRG